jgi:hypothetical protein
MACPRAQHILTTWRTWLATLPSLALAAALLAGGASAGDATPTPDAPPPELCQVTAPSLAQLNAIVATPPAEPGGTPAVDVIPSGTPADVATLAGITATLRELVGCYNAGELLRSYGLYTEDYLRRLFYRQGAFTQAAYDGLATPEPAPVDKRVQILAIENPRLLPDGRSGMTVTLRYARVPMPKRLFFVFVQEGGRWLIDDIIGEISFSVP